MKKLLFLSLPFLFVFQTQAQSAYPYHAFGFEVRLGASTITPNKSLMDENGNLVGQNLFESGIYSIDVYGHYDLGFSQKFGLNTGLGLIVRGGTSRINFQEEAHREIYYITLPLIFQYKPWKYFWLEAGVENRFLTAVRDVDYPTYQNNGQTVQLGPFPTDDLFTYSATWQAGFRVRLYRGLSIGAHWFSQLGHMAELDDFVIQDYSVQLSNSGLGLGLRYMFNQPR